MENKYRFLLYTLLLLCTTSRIFAEKISQQTAMLVAKNFYYEAQTSKKIEYNQISVSEIFDVKRDGNSVYYAFNFTNGGFVIVSADDFFTPVIGYNTEGVYNETNAPENWQWLMNEYAEMLAFGQKQKMETNPEYTPMWQHLTADKPSSLSRGSREIIVVPLTKAMWYQDYPYNYYAPLDPRGSGGRVYTGCVATAMSIIMQYWRWPKQGTGSHSYTPSLMFCDTQYPVQYANFGETGYFYEGMPYTLLKNISENPVALLMYHCGVSVDMMYCYSGSGAYSHDVPAAIKKYFKYDNSAKIYYKDYMNEQTWKNLLKTDLDKGFPLYASGQSTSGGHAFVCDGYTSDDLFHYNFGWGGAANGYYTVNNIYGFSSSQGAINNFIPDVEQYDFECPEFTYVPFATGTIADCSGPVKNYKPNTSASWLIDPDMEEDMTRKTVTIECELLDLAPGDYLRIYDGSTETSTLLVEYTTGSQPQTINSTGSKVFIRFTSTPTSETAKGFLLNYKATTVKCSDEGLTIFTEPEGSFDDGSGEGFYYAHSMQCRWRILPENAQSIVITFNYFETEKGKDIVRITDFTTNKTIESLSGIYTQENLPTVTVPSGKVQIIFTTNKTENAKGFELNYKAILSNGIDEQNQAVNALTIAPNPASNNLNLTFFTSHNDDIKIEIYNVLGKHIYNESLTDFSGNYHKTINIEKLSQGIYFLKITSSNGISVRKIIKN